MPLAEGGGMEIKMDENQNAIIENIIMKLEKNEISVLTIPQEYQNNLRIVQMERKNGLRVTKERGYDVIGNKFFVNEILFFQSTEGDVREKKILLFFKEFNEYYSFLNGDIYQNACYRFYNFSTEIISKYSLDVFKIKKIKAFITDTITDVVTDTYPIISENEKLQYKEAEMVHKQCCDWIKKFNDCMTITELKEVVENYRMSKLHNVVDECFFFFNYIFKDTNDKHRFDVIMEYISSEAYPSVWMKYGMCLIFDPDDVLNAYTYNCSSFIGTKSTFYKHKRELAKFVENIKEGKIKFCTRYYFDNKTHFFCEETRGYAVINKRYFETFEEFSAYRGYNLKNTDLSLAYGLRIDKSAYLIDETTKLPVSIENNLHCDIQKKYEDGFFYVYQEWKNEYGAVVNEHIYKFKYFFDFVYFLNGDLTDADLLFCKGLNNLVNCDGVDLSNAILPSRIYKKFEMKFNPISVNENQVKSFPETLKNEETTVLTLKENRNMPMIRNSMRNVLNGKSLRVNYVSDIHLMHKIVQANCISKGDIIYLIKKIVCNIAKEVDGLLLIDGDVSSEYWVFEQFIIMLSKEISRETVVVFTLGNHELWGFSGQSLLEIEEKYRTLIEANGMYLLQNDLFISNDLNEIKIIKYDTICKMQDMDIRNLARNARYVIYGGIGFAGYNKKFNATCGIYRNTISREYEIIESRKFEEMYFRLCSLLRSKSVVILSHTPKTDWCSKQEYESGYVYVSGHTHRNYFYDDGVMRVYCDNQIGYKNESVHLKTFLINNEYDIFFDYKDGIYEITAQQYNDFYRGKNIAMNFQRRINILYMLKKKGYYCFIHKSKIGELSILNGGTLKQLERKDIQYYYENMEIMIEAVMSPLDKFTQFQKRISKAIRRIGGSGNIHGAIVDIDFFNHVYVNPLDMTITGYWASDIINKVVYPTISALLEAECPKLYEQYKNDIMDKNDNVLLAAQNINLSLIPQKYLETNIYTASREIRKMQRLNSNILTSWYDNMICQNLIVEKCPGNAIRNIRCQTPGTNGADGEGAGGGRD